MIAVHVIEVQEAAYTSVSVKRALDGSGPITLPTLLS